MKARTALLAMSALALLDTNRLSGPLPYNPTSPLPPQSRAEDERRIASAQAKRDRKAARKNANSP